MLHLQLGTLRRRAPVSPRHNPGGAGYEGDTFIWMCNPGLPGVYRILNRVSVAMATRSLWPV